jgi:hypothetical protein
MLNDVLEVDNWIAKEALILQEFLYPPADDVWFSP